MLQSLPINDKGLDVYSKNTHIVNDKLCYLVSNEENTSSSIDIGKGNYKIIVPQIYVLTDYQAGFVNKNIGMMGSQHYLSIIMLITFPVRPMNTVIGIVALLFMA